MTHWITLPDSAIPGNDRLNAPGIETATVARIHQDLASIDARLHRCKQDLAQIGASPQSQPIIRKVRLSGVNPLGALAGERASLETLLRKAKGLAWKLGNQVEMGVRGEPQYKAQLNQLLTDHRNIKTRLAKLSRAIAVLEAAVRGRVK
jgi:hypothetical protein